MFRQNTYTEGEYYDLMPVFRKAVVPGESVALDLTTIFETEPFSQNILSGGIASLYAFYTPYRLVWDQWVSWVAEPQSAAVLPTATTAWTKVFEAGTSTKSMLGRRAYKLIYNQFFGQDVGTTDLWYSNIATDTDTSVKRLRTTDQINGKLMLGSDVSTPTASYPVSGATTTIDLNDLRQRLRDARSTRRQDMTGDKYVDAMARMGVSLDWRVQLAPEMLGVAHKDFIPKDTRATDPANTGRAWSRYQETLNLRTSRKFFAEHGVIWVVLAVRPHVFPVTARGAMDAEFLNISRETVFVGDNDVGTVTPADVAIGATGGGTSYRMPRWAQYRSGQNLVGQTSFVTTGNQPWIPRQNVDVTSAVYPAPGLTTSYVDQLPAGVLAAYTVGKAVGPTPVKANII